MSEREGRYWRIITLALVLLSVSGGQFAGSTFVAAAEVTSAQKGEPNDPNAPDATSTVRVDDTAAVAKLTTDDLLTSKKQAVESKDLGEDVKAKISEVYDEAIAQLKLADELAAKLKQFKQNRTNAPALLKDVQLALEQVAVSATLDASEDMTLSQAEQGLAKVTLELEGAKKKIADLEGEPKRRADRHTKIPEESRMAKQQLEDIQKKFSAGGEDEGQAPLARANRVLLQLQKRAAENRIGVNAEELLFYDATKELLAGQRDLAMRQSAVAEKLITLWQDKVGILRQQAAEAAKNQAIREKDETRYSHKAVQALAQENLKLAELQSQLLTKVQRIKDDSTAVGTRVATIREDFLEISRQVETAGKVTDTMGMILLGQREKLPITGDMRRRIRNRPDDIATAQLAAMEHDKKWSDLSDLSDEIGALDEQFASSIDQTEREAIRKEATGYYETRRKTLRAISDLHWDYATQLAALDASEQSLVELVDSLNSFIDTNVLWVRSSQMLGVSDARQTARALAWIVSPTNWRRVGGAVWADCKGQPSYYFLVVLLVPVMIVFRVMLRSRIMSMRKLVRQVQTDRFLYTVLTLAFSGFLALTLPIFLLFSYHRLWSVSPGDFGRGIAAGLLKLAFVLFIFDFLKYLIMPGGLAEEHLRVRGESLAFVRKHLRWLFVLSVPVVFVFEVMQTQHVEDAWYGTVGRLSFVIGLVGLAIFLLKVLRPTSPLMDSYLKHRRGGWLERLRYFWYPVCFGLPLSFAVLAGMGYLYGAHHLNQKLLLTMALVLSIVLVRALFVRGLAIAQRRLAHLERLNRQAAVEHKSEPGSGIDSSTGADQSVPQKTKPKQSIFEISRQTRRIIGAAMTILLLFGFWYIWKAVLPAIAAVGEYPLYDSAGEVVTLGSVVTALVVVVTTVIMARNVPGLMEIMILRRLPLDSGVRFAIITICRYILVVIGVILAFAEIGISWSKVQWLVAAMTVGLGFGLQEIFANFVSGLIILFEQPVRVDDVVTVGEVTGQVTMIKIRATTIRQWDQRELIVPNKEFITGHLINWTLSDSVLRIDFSVGIAYGSDIRKAERLLYEIAAADERVMNDPEPVVLFNGFGDSSLCFELRVHITGISNRLPVRHAINVAIDDRFREAGVEIAFPQRDLHIRSVDPSISSSGWTTPK
jgi:potassium efflux system protein